MITIPIDQSELLSIELIRMALSEESQDARVKAVKAVKHDIVATRVALLTDRYGPDWTHEPENADLVRWIADSAAERHEAVHEFSEVKTRYEAKHEKKLNVAEHTGKLIWHSIQDGKFEGVQTPNGILQQVQDAGREENIRGAKDKDVIRKNWSTYRGVAHIGMAIDFCESNPSRKNDILKIAEQVRRSLSQNCPKGTSKPYVDPG
uniref:hypothetical protein n=1 Tax=Litoreibacter halocynthiae TaxID=1242689 RepID=UPI00248FA41A